jgi:hypothetical protein
MFYVTEPQITASIVEKAQNELKPVPPKREIPKSFKERLYAFTMLPWVRLSAVTALAVFMIAVGRHDYPSHGVLSNTVVIQSSAQDIDVMAEAKLVAFNHTADFPGFEINTGFQDLLDNWELSVTPVDVVKGDLCQRYPLPETHSCYVEENNFSVLVANNRPALVEFSQQYYVLLATDNERAVFQTADQLISISLQELKEQWQGKAWWIAEISPSLHLPLLPGSKSNLVSWLQDAFSTIYQLPKVNIELLSDVLENPQWLRQDGMYSYLYSKFQYLQPNDDFLFDEQLTDLVKRFQTENGLSNSGVVDVQTLLRIQDRLGSSQTLRSNIPEATVTTVSTTESVSSITLPAEE